MARHVLRLVEFRSSHILERQPRYRVMLNDTPAGELYYNTRGYVGTLPTVDGAAFTPGERPISTWRKEAAAINRESAAALRAGADDPRRITDIRPTEDNRTVFAMSRIGEGDARPHLLSRRAFMRAEEIFGAGNIGMGFFREDGFRLDGRDMPRILLRAGDEWMTGILPENGFRIMPPDEQWRHDQYVAAIHETSDPETRLVIGRNAADDADPEPLFVTRQSLDFSRMILGDKMRLGDLTEAAPATIPDPAAREALHREFAWLPLNGPDPLEAAADRHEREQSAITAGHELSEAQGTPLDAAQAHEVEQWKLTGPET